MCFLKALDNVASESQKNIFAILKIWLNMLMKIDDCGKKWLNAKKD